MSSTLKTRLIKYGISFSVSFGMAWFYVSLRDFQFQPLMEKYRILCDAFTIPGMVFILLGLLMILSNQGALDGISYAAQYAARLLIPGALTKHKQERYLDYVERKRANRAKGFGFLFVTGVVTMAIALVFMYLFYQLYGA